MGPQSVAVETNPDADVATADVVAAEQPLQSQGPWKASRPKESSTTRSV
jgi:hypothetical protein